MTTRRLPFIDRVHRVGKTLSGRRRVRYHYAFRGGPKFWTEPTDGYDHAAYVRAYDAARKTSPVSEKSTIAKLVTEYLSSAEFRGLRERTRRDNRKWADRFSDRFGKAPLSILENRRFRDKVMQWRDGWKHSPRQADNAWGIAKLLANWAKNRGLIMAHVLEGGGKLYHVDRSDMVWTKPEIEAFLAIAPEYVRRILVTALATGLRAGDLTKLSRAHIRDGVISMRTEKRQTMASLPILPELQAIIDETPSGRLAILSKAHGEPLTPDYASKLITRWRREAGITRELHLHDARGTATTRLVRAGVPLDQIALWMSWKPDYAQKMLVRYLALDPDRARDAGRLVMEFERRKGEGA